MYRMNLKCLLIARRKEAPTTGKKVKVLVAQSCLILCDPIDCSPPGSSVHGILQARIQSRLPFPPPGDLSGPGIEPASPMSPALAGGFFTTVPPGKPSLWALGGS